MDVMIYQIVLGALAVVCLLLLMRGRLTNRKLRELAKSFEESEKGLSIAKQRIDTLKRYEAIEDAELEAKRITDEAAEQRNKVEADCSKLAGDAKKSVESELDEAKRQASEIVKKAEDHKADSRRQADEMLEKAELKYQAKIEEAELLSKTMTTDARAEAKAMREKAKLVLDDANEVASGIEAQAKQKAEQIAGDAWEAKKNAEQYSATATAMKNIIKGYGDEYLVPNESVLDVLADEYDHTQAGRDLKAIKLQLASMIKSGDAADCDYVEAHRKATAIEFVLDAYNGKIDSIMSKVKHDNYGKLHQQVEDAFRVVNHNGKPFRDARIRSRYHETMVQQLKMAVTVQELKRKDMEEQRRIKQEMREEEKARREYEKAIKAAEKEERLLHKAMKEAEAKLAGAAAEERLKYEQQLEELNNKLADAEAKGQRAISMAQQTRQGHVYVISNVGSFGDDVFKIGLTRRLEPLDRVKELGDASVPFCFDVHAMIHSEDAPKLEKDLHSIFADNQVNKVNQRKEFFRVPLSEVRSRVEELGMEVHWTMKAEALEYRESVQLAIRKPVAEAV